MNRTRLKIVGQSGSGLLTVGDLTAQMLESIGFFVCSDREYPSLIKGGYSCYTINFAEEPIQSLSEEADIMVAIDKPSLLGYHSQLKKQGILFSSFEINKAMGEVCEFIEHNEIQTTSIPCSDIAKEHGGTKMMTNIILLGALAKAVNRDYKHIETKVYKKFEKKTAIVDLVMKCLRGGYEYPKTKIEIPHPKENPNTKLINGNQALTLGAIHAGCQIYCAYPMSPASSILAHMAQYEPKTKMIVKQVEDEITAAQMALGAMSVGTRAFTATSGGGFDLMTETLSVAGIMESPFVVGIVQRPGPGTGLPTWTAQGDLNLAIHAGHGEYPRIVIGCSTPEKTFELIQHAFNKAEQYQVPVLVLSEKVIAESKITIPPLKEKTIPIERGLISDEERKHIKGHDRYKITESGVSPRWLPGQSDEYYYANGDEHGTKGELDESAHAGEMYEKRMRKLQTIKNDLPEPTIYGPETADISFIGWGSSLNIMLDIQKLYPEKTINYLHYDYVWPVKEKKAIKFFEQNKNVHLIENNYNGQFGAIIEAETHHTFKDKLLKWNGRPFFLEDLQTYIGKHLQQ
jgi:2-oxoglutarate ferredoxin oxidoreductase subunit alpha